MKDKYGQIMDRVKLTDAMREEVLRNVLDAAEKPAVAAPERSSVPRRRLQRWKRDLAAGLCAAAAAAACFLAVPAFRAPFAHTTSVSNLTSKGPVVASPADGAVPETSEGGVSELISAAPSVVTASGPVTQRPQSTTNSGVQAAVPSTRPAAPGPERTRQPAAPAGVGGVQTLSEGTPVDPAPTLFVGTDGIVPAPEPDVDGGHPASGQAPVTASYTHEITGGATPLDNEPPAAVPTSHAAATAGSTLEALPEPTEGPADTVTAAGPESAVPVSATAPPHAMESPEDSSTPSAAGPVSEPSVNPTASPSPSPSPSDEDDEEQEGDDQAANS